MKPIPRLSSLALKSLATRKARTLLTILGITLGVAVILATAVANDSTVAVFRVMIDSITGKADFWINGASPAGFDESAIDRVREVDGVAVANPGIAKGASLLIRGSHSKYVQAAGIDPRTDRRLRRYNLVSGRFLWADEAAVLLTKRFADENKLKPGDRIRLLTPTGRHRLNIVGLLKDEGAGRFMSGNVAFIPLVKAQEIFNLRGRLTYIDAKAAAGRSLPSVRNAISRELGDSFIVEQPEKRVEAVSQMLRGLKVGLTFFGAIAMFVGGFLVYNTFSMVVLEQTRELGILRCLGADRRQAAFLVLTQAMMVGAAGGVLGVAGGIFLARFLLGFMARTVDLPIEVLSVPVLGLVSAVAVGLSVTIASALQPAIIASRVSPMAAIKVHALGSSAIGSAARYLVGLLGLAAGLAISFLPGENGLGRYASLAVPIHAGGNFSFLLGAAILSPLLVRPLSRLFGPPASRLLGTPGRLAADNLNRNPGRTAATASAVMITMAMLISVGGMTTSFRLSVEKWVDKSLGADVFVSGRSTDVSFKKDLTAKLKAVEGVDDITTIRFVPVRENNRQILWRAIEPRGFKRFASLQFTEGETDEAWRLFRRGGHVFISTVLANKRRLKVGDRITVATARGPKRFKVAGVAVDFGGEMGDLVIGRRADMKRYFGLDDVSSWRIKAKPGVKPREVANRIKKKFKRLDLEIQDIQEFKDMADRQVNNSFAVFQVLIILAALVAAIGIFNTLMMNIFERRREIGLLRAFGAERGQVGLMTVTEAFITGAIGALLGLIVGGYSAGDIVNGMKSLTGYEVTFVFPVGPSGVALGAAIILSVAAAIYPAWRAANTPISEALQYE